MPIRAINAPGDAFTTLYRVWPDGTTQEADEAPYTWMSDDFVLVWALDEGTALRIAKRRGHA